MNDPDIVDVFSDAVLRETLIRVPGSTRAKYAAEIIRLRAEIAAIRAIVLPHPTATPEEDYGCGCAMLSTIEGVRDVANRLAKFQREVER